MVARERVLIDVEAETKRYQQRLSKIPGITEKEAKDASKRFVKQIRAGQIRAVVEAETAAKKAAKAWGNAGDVIIGTLSADAIKSAGSAFFDLASEVAETRGEIIRLSGATGIATDTIAGISVAVDMVGGNSEAARDSMADFGERMFDAAAGGGEAEDAFRLLGFTQKDLQKRTNDTNGVFVEAVQLFSRMEAGANKNAVGQQLFGDASLDLSAALQAIPLDDAIKLADRYGLTIDENAVAATASWNASLAQLQGELSGATVDLLEFLEVGEGLAAFTTGISTLRDIASETFAESTAQAGRFRDVLEEIADPQGSEAKIIDGLLEIGAKGKTAWDRIIDGAFESQFEVLRLNQTLDDTTEPMADIALALAGLREQTRKNAEEAEKAAKKAAKAQKEALRQQLADAKEVTAVHQDELDFFQRAEDANEALAAQAKALNRELLDDEETIQATFEDRIELIREIAKESSDVFALQDAMAAAEKVRLRELSDLDKERAEDLRDLARIEVEVAQDVDSALEAFHTERLERAAELTFASIEAFDQIAAAAVVFQGLELARLEELAAARAADIELQLDERADLEKAIEEGSSRIGELDAAINEERLRDQLSTLNEEIAADGEATDLQLLERERLIEELALLDDAASVADLERDAAALDAQIATEQEFLAEQNAELVERFRASQNLQVAATVISGASAGIAALAPPPIGAGPIVGAFIATGIAAATVAAVAKIKAEQPPQFPVGFPGFTRAGDTFTAEIEPGESVNTRRVTDELGGPAAVDRMNQGGSAAQASDMPAASDRDGLLRALGQLMAEEAGRGRELTQELQRRDGRALPPIGKRPVYPGRR